MIFELLNSHIQFKRLRTSRKPAKSDEKTRAEVSADAIFPRHSATLSLPTRTASSGTSLRSTSPTPAPPSQGLHVLHSPELPAIDIIFVHGLGGHSHRTWTKNHDPALFWPENWLPFEPDMGAARILTFGYNASWRGASKSMATISDFAKELLYEMRFASDEAGNNLDIGARPIIFVVHSMGGLVVKKAYLMGLHDDNFKNIIASVSAIIFLSTPHRGTNLAEALNRLVAATFQSSKSFISDLNKSSHALEELNEQFRHLAPNLSIWSFYETIATNIGPRKIMVLEKDTSILGYPSEISRPLQADHQNICKYGSPSDSNYVSVRNAIKSLVSTFRSGSQGQSDERAPVAETLSLTELFRNCTTTEDEYKALRRCWIPNTCGWFLEIPEFVSWMSDTQGSSVLWYHGPPASGKSVLSAFLVNHLRESKIGCQYFFFKHSDRRKSSAATSLKAIALQMAKDMPEFRKKLSTLPTDSSGLESEDPEMIWRDIFEKAFSGPHVNGPLYWVVDALDECQSPKIFLNCLKNFVKVTVPIKILVVSRVTDSIAIAFDRLSSSVPVQRIDITGHSHINKDIGVLINQEIAHMRGSDEVRDLWRRAVMNRSLGNFLWTKLVLDEIMSCHTEESILEVLNQAPIDIFELYQRMEGIMVQSTRNSNIPLIRSLLEWSTCSAVPLTLQEMSHALHPEFSIILDLRRTITDTCGQFVQINERGKVGIMHHTAREYLLRNPESQFYIDEKQTHIKLFQKTLLALGDPSLRLGLTQQQHALRSAQPFVFYSAQSWSWHMARSGGDHSAILDHLVGFLRSPAVLSWIHALSLMRRIDVLVKTSKFIAQLANETRKRNASKNPMVHRLSDLELLDSWAADMTKLFGKFRRSLMSAPDIIYDIVPALSPGHTAVSKQFYDVDSSTIQILGLQDVTWNDNYSRIAFPPGTQTWSIANAGRTLAVLTSTGIVHLWDTFNFMEMESIDHAEPVMAMALNSSGTKLVTCGLKATKVWMVPSGKISLSGTYPSAKMAFSINNPPHTRAMSIVFAEDDRRLLVGGDDKVIRYAICAESDKGWRVLHQDLLKETATDGTFTNSPICLAFSEDCAHVAVSYRRAPLSVWRLSDGRCISKCRRAKNSQSGDRQPSSNWCSVERFTWNPVTGHILGIYKHGCIFKWHPLTNETVEVPKRVDEIAVSPNGKLFATTSSDGSIRVWSFTHFSVIYQLSSDDLVTGLAFSANSRQFYDLRGGVMNVWEPDSVTRFDEIEAKLSDSSSEGRSSTEVSKFSEEHVTAFEAITAIAVCPDGSSYCAGYADGGVLIFPDNGDQSFELARFYNSLEVTHISWSPDGHYVAVADLTGDLQVKSVTIARDRTVQVTPLSNPQIELKSSNIREMLFSPDSSMLLVSAAKEAFVYSVEDARLIATADAALQGDRKWFAHPTSPDLVVACGSQDAQFYSWATMETQGGVKFDEPTDEPVAIGGQGKDHAASKSNAMDHSSTLLVRAKLCQDSIHLLLATSNGSSTRTSGGHVLVSRLDDWQPDSNATINLNRIPPDVSRHVYLPLGVLPGSKLVFLDHDLWLCVYRLAGIMSPIAESYQRYYFVPRDWVGSYSLDTCVLTKDGTLFWARDGRVVQIRCNLDFARPVAVL